MDTSPDTFSGLAELPPSVPRVLYEHPSQLPVREDSIEKRLLRENHALQNEKAVLMNALQNEKAKVNVLQNEKAVLMNEINMRRQRERDLEHQVALESNLNLFSARHAHTAKRDKNLNPWYEGEAEPPRYEDVVQLPETSGEEKEPVPRTSPPRAKKQRVCETWTCEICESTLNMCNRTRHLQSTMHLMREHEVNSKSSSS
jgi:hypothetical protein